MSPALDHQPGIMSKEEKNLVLLSHAAVLQKEAETGSKVGTVIFSSSNKYSCAVLYDALKNSEFSLLK